MIRIAARSLGLRFAELSWSFPVPFWIIWLGQLAAFTGTGLIGFGLGLWVLEQTGSATQFGVVLLATVAPIFLVSPLAGSLVDRHDRRWMLLLSDLGGGLSSVVLLTLLATGRLEVWHTYLTAALGSSLSAFKAPAYNAIVTALITKEGLGRASGVVQMGEAIARIVAPALGGFLLVRIGLRGLGVLHLVAFALTAASLLLVRLPRRTPRAPAADASAVPTGFGASFRFLARRQGLLGLVVVSALTSLLFGALRVLFPPMVLGFASVEVVGLLFATGGVGMVFGSLVMGLWGGPERRVDGVLGFTLLLGLITVVGGLRPSVHLLLVVVFLFFTTIPLVTGSSRALLQVKVPLGMQGRFFALRQMLTATALAASYLTVGPLADGIFEPFMASDAPMAVLLGGWIGHGPGRGIALLLGVIGLGTMGFAALGYLLPRLRQLETELPDANDPIVDNPGRER